jgi:DNA polymerase (family 10)
MTNADVARVFSRLATMLEIDGANPFRVRAYREAARIVEEQTETVSALASEEGRLEELPGIGKDLATKIRELVATGTTPLYEEMQKKVPLSVVDLTELQGLGPKRVKTLFEVLGITNRDELAKAAREEKLRELPGFGKTVEQNVLKALDVAARDVGRMLLAGTWDVAHALVAHVSKMKGVTAVELAGSFRRRKETIGDLDLLVTGGSAAAVMKTFVTYPEAADVLGEGDTKSSIRLRNGLQVDLRHVPAESFGAAMMYFTGSKEHNIELRRIAIDKGWSLNEYGLTRGETVVAARTEEEVYRALDLDWIPPELREMRGEIELARAGRLPKLIEESDLVADLHMHTDRTDGRESLETMVRACKERGYCYCAITDHSAALAMIGGFDGARVRQSVKEIEAVRKKVPGIEVLHGLEVDILPDGALDLDDASLALLDWVIVSLHAKIDQPAAVMTKRVLGAISHPAVHMMGHPTGRAIGSRQPAAFDMEQVLDRAAELGVAMEINSQPNRLDLNDTHARRAKEKGVRIAIDTDAHSIRQLDQMRFGVFVGRRAGLEKDDVLNAQPFDAFRKAIRQRSGTAVPPNASTPAAKPEMKVAGRPKPTAAKGKPAATKTPFGEARKPGAKRPKWRG